MSLAPHEIEHLIREHIPVADVTISDPRGDGQFLAAFVVSPAFLGKTRLEQHRMVHDALRGRFDYDRQNFALQTAAPETH